MKFGDVYSSLQHQNTENWQSNPHLFRWIMECYWFHLCCICYQSSSITYCVIFHQDIKRFNSIAVISMYSHYVIVAKWQIYASVNWATFGSDNCLVPGRHQAIVWTNAGVLLSRPSETNFCEILIVIHISTSKKMNLILLFTKCWPFCLSPNVLIYMSISWHAWASNQS